MKTLFKGGTVVNVFTGVLEQANVLIEDEKIIGVGLEETQGDVVVDVTGQILCPGFIDGHIHIESTALVPEALARIALKRGTTALVADPHEIANVCGVAGIEYMLEASEGLPLTMYMMLPSCVPATPFDESGAVLTAKDLEPFYAHPRVLGLAEMMNYPGVLAGDAGIREKIRDAEQRGKAVDGHAPLLTGVNLNRYLAEGIGSDHECSSFQEATERIRKGQWVMIRQGTAARNLDDLIDLFDQPWNRRCLLVTDDRHPADLIQEGHIDAIIRRAVELGKSAVVGIQMATIQAAQYFGLRDRGAIAPGYRADFLILDDLDTIAIKDVYAGGIMVVEDGVEKDFASPVVGKTLLEKVKNTMHLDILKPEDFKIFPEGNRCRAIGIIPKQLLTKEVEMVVDMERGNGVDLSRDLIKIAVVERHKNTGHRGIGYITGFGLKEGAIASSVAHDSHNLVVIGTNDADMALAVNRLRELGGGGIAVKDGAILAEMPLPIAGLMSEDEKGIVSQNQALRECIHMLGVPEEIAPLMTMSFMGLTVIPDLKMSTLGLIDVNSQTRVPLFLSE